MNFTISDIEKLARLARIQLTAEEKKKYTKQLSSILEYVQKVDTVDTSHADTSFHIPELKNIKTDDVVAPLESNDVLDAAPRTSGRTVEIPPLVHE